MSLVDIIVRAQSEEISEDYLKNSLIFFHVSILTLAGNPNSLPIPPITGEILLISTLIPELVLVVVIPMLSSIPLELYTNSR